MKLRVYVVEVCLLGKWHVLKACDDFKAARSRMRAERSSKTIWRSSKYRVTRYEATR